MEEERIEFGPERRKEDQLARFGARPSPIGEFGYAIHTPSEIAANKLSKALEKYPDITQEGRQIFRNEFVDMPNLRYMNMKVMAAVISFMNKNKFVPENFKDDIIIPYMSQLLPKDGVSPEDRRRLIIRFKAQMLIYIRSILRFIKL